MNVEQTIDEVLGRGLTYTMRVDLLQARREEE